MKLCRLDRVHGRRRHPRRVRIQHGRVRARRGDKDQQQRQGNRYPGGPIGTKAVSLMTRNVGPALVAAVAARDRATFGTAPGDRDRATAGHSGTGTVDPCRHRGAGRGSMPGARSERAVVSHRGSNRRCDPGRNRELPRTERLGSVPGAGVSAGAGFSARRLGSVPGGWVQCPAAGFSARRLGSVPGGLSHEAGHVPRVPAAHDLSRHHALTEACFVLVGDGDVR
jgi:hypothetical protein